VATSGDFVFLRDLLSRRTLRSPVLEIGSRDWNGNTQDDVVAAGLAWSGCDIEAGPGVDFILDIFDEAGVSKQRERWGSVALFNLLEHVYDPPQALAAAISMLEPQGVCVVVSPVVWELHGFPRDYWRPLPDFYEEFAARNGLEITDRSWIVGDELLPVNARLPGVARGSELWGRGRWLYSRLIHRLANTTGRNTFFPYSAFGVVLRKPGGGNQPSTD
jgi:hypothetical protein